MNGKDREAPHRFHITGASGTGTTTLGRALASRLDCPHFDTDDYFWQPTDPRFQAIREPEERIALMRPLLSGNPTWALSGSLCGWGDGFIPLFDFVIFLTVPSEIRMSRLRERERREFGSKIDPGGIMHEAYTGFIEWASQYDGAGLEMRSRALHEKWLADLPCPVLRVEGVIKAEEQVERVLELIP